MTILYTRSLFHAVEEISTRIAMDHLRRGLKLKVPFLLLTWQVWQGGFWLIFKRLRRFFLDSSGVAIASFYLCLSLSLSLLIFALALITVGGSCFVNSFLSRCRQLYALQSILTIRLPSSKQCGSWHGLWLLGEVSTGLRPCEMSEQGRLGKRLAFPCVLWQSLLPSFAKIPELVASCFARQCKLPKQQSLLHEMNLSMRCGAWRPSCMQAPADPNPYSINFTFFRQQNSFTWSSGRRLLILRHCSVSITTLILNGCLPFTGKAMSLMRCTWARKRGLLGRLVLELQNDAVAKSPIKPLNVPLTWVQILSS